MIIGIDGNEANVDKRVGSNVFAYEVIKGIYEIEKVKKDKDSFVVYLKDKAKEDFPSETKWWKYKVIGPKKMWTRVALPVSLYLGDKCDVFFAPGHYGPRFCPCPLVISILDTSYFDFDQYYKKNDLYQLREWTKQSVERAEKIVTISKSSKKDIMKHYGKKDDEVVVCYPGYDKQKFNTRKKEQKKEIEEVKKKYKIDKDYIIYVGTLQPRKNIVKLIEAFNLIKIKERELKLVVVGKRGWMYEEIFEKVKRLNLDSEVIFTGYVEDDEVGYLVAGAREYVLPSLYEGFGIPVVEAKSLGVVTVVSKNSSLEEVGGRSSIFIDDVDNVGEIEKGIEKGLNLNDKEKNEIIRLGLKEVEEYSWEKCAEKILYTLISFK